MDKIFNPSLLISIGPSAKKVLDLTKDKLKQLPKSFNRLIEYFEVNKLEEVEKNLQEIIDERLLEVNALNAMVDLGYKIRSSSSSSVKIDAYVFLDMCNSEISASSIIETLTELNYGVLDKSQHSGATIFLFLILDKNISPENMKELRQVSDYISKQENMMKVDSKIYLFNSIANDGTRVSNNELEHMISNIVYYNVLPSKDHPLHRFNRKILMHEGKFKIGTIGISSIGFDEEKLLEDFSRALAVDIIKYARENEEAIDYKQYKVCKLINLKNIKGELSKDVNIIKDNNGGYTLNRVAEFHIKLPNSMEEYPEIFKNWEIFIEHKCLNSLKGVIDKNYNNRLTEVINEINEDIHEISIKYGMKEALKYLDEVKSFIMNCNLEQGKVTSYKTDELNKELQYHIDNYQNKVGLNIKVCIFSAFVFWSFINLWQYFKENFFIFGVFLIIFGFIVGRVYFDYSKKRKKPFEFIEEYKKKVFHKTGTLAGLYIDRRVNEFRESVLKEISNIREDILEFMKNSAQVAENLESKYSYEDKKAMSFRKDILNLNDRKRFYLENKPKVDNIYTTFMRGIESYYESPEEIIRKILIFTKIISHKFVNLDFYRFLTFKYGEDLEKILDKWFISGFMKNQYQLQYINTPEIEEYYSIVVSPQLSMEAKRLVTKGERNTEVSIVGDDGIILDSMSIIKVCLGIDLDNVPILKIGSVLDQS